ncbi:hypothetical protein [Paenarthrobacter sp. A20]|uniref:hypothetical protein n=1 Tax=Paenarthrobacter sp. A20 TaxID=2817891 RepID=UPI00209D2680|nr:hypothetical protein [Paenarthrobacter sp. A20]MCP1415422.1 NAD(P)-dependent dehydrogenase (short-subunit alcohol dehydrogenase family) [Paenarthrobacter sp. A20]
MSDSIGLARRVALVTAAACRLSREIVVAVQAAGAVVVVTDIRAAQEKPTELEPVFIQADITSTLERDVKPFARDADKVAAPALWLNGCNTAHLRH